MCTCEQHTYTSSEHFHLEEGETMLARGNENFLAPGENRTRDLPNPVIPGILSYEPVFDRKIAENFGYVSSVQEAYKLIAEFETRSTTKFSCFKVDKDFGNIGVYLRFVYYCAFHKHPNSEVPKPTDDCVFRCRQSS